MKRLIYFIAIIFVLPLVSCNDDFLDKTPLDQISEPDFWKSTSDLELYANNFYNNLPSWSLSGVGSSPLPDNGTDLTLGTAPSSRLMGNTSVPSAATTSIWSFTNIRKANYFLANVSKAEGAAADILQYTGEGYFFRAYHYFDKLNTYGDVPIIDKYITNTDEDYLYKARDPRNKVADFILADLDSAIAKLKNKSAMTTPRINKEAALLLKARVALYEGTWEKYHSNTAFGVSGSTGTAYLQKAADAAKAIIDGGTLTLHSDYGGLFNQTTLKTNTEIILWRQYDFLTFGKSYGNDVWNWPNASGYSRFAVRSYLCSDGLPISKSPLYKGDLSLSTVETNRDPRLAATIMVPGDVKLIAINGTVTYFTAPLLGATVTCVTGYESQKYRIPQIDNTNTLGTKNEAKIIMRYAEALLIYAEAKAELGTLTQADLDISINKLRLRAKMPILTMSSITVDPDWPNYGYTLTPVLYEIRRERTVELIAEGFRFDDLMRWRAHSLFVGQRPRGAYYETLLYNVSKTQKVDADKYLDPYQTSVGTAGYLFNPNKDYLSPLPTDQLVLNPQLVQNPGWE